MSAFKNIDIEITKFMQLVNAYAAAVAKVHECNFKNDAISHNLMRDIAVDNQKKIRAIASQLFLNNAKGLKNA